MDSEQKPYAKGYAPGTVAKWFGPNNPPPKSPGRPPGLSLRERLRVRLRKHPEEADEIVRALLEHAYRGDAAMMRLVIDSCDGPQALRVVGLSREALVEELSALVKHLAASLPPEVVPQLAQAAREFFASRQP